jgi:hypothetical protein
MESEGIDAKDLPAPNDEEERQVDVIGGYGGEEKSLAGQRDPGKFPPSLADTAKEAVRRVETNGENQPGLNEERPRAVGSAATRPTSRPQAKKPRLAPIASPAPPPPPPPPLNRVFNADGTWNCPTCTLINSSDALTCDACAEPRPRDESKGWWCDVCLEFGNTHDRWMCQSCGSIKRKG